MTTIDYSVVEEHEQHLFGDNSLNIHYVETEPDNFSNLTVRSNIRRMSQQLKADCNIYFKVTAYHKNLDGKHRHGEATQRGEVNFFWLDVDHAEGDHSPTELPKPCPADAIKILTTLLPQASMIVDSGGGFYAYYRFDKPLKAPDCAPFIRNLSEHVKHIFEAEGFYIDDVSDLPRMLRPAGVINHKYGNMTTIFDKSDAVYTPADLMTAFKRLSNYTPDLSDDEPSTTIVDSGDDKSKPASIKFVEQFAEHVDIVALMGHVGCKFFRDNPESVEFQRVDTENVNSKSLKVFKDSGAVTVFSSTLKDKWGLRGSSTSLYSIAKSSGFRNVDDFKIEPVDDDGEGESDMLVDSVDKIVEDLADFIGMQKSKLKSFPVHVFPSWVAQMCQNLSYEMKADSSLVACVALSAMAAATFKNHVVRWHKGEYEQHTNLFIMPCGEPGAGKSPASKELYKPIRKWDNKIRKDCEGLEPFYRRKQSEAQKRLDKAVGQGDDMLGKKWSLEVSKYRKLCDNPPRLIVSDATEAALTEAAVANGGVAVLDTEGSQFFQSLNINQETGASNSVLLKGWSFDETDGARISRDMSTGKVLLNVCLLAQEPILDKYILNDEARRLGKTDRFLYYLAEQNLLSQKGGIADVDRRVREVYNDNMYQIVSNPRRTVLTLNAEAHKFFEDWIDQSMEFANNAENPYSYFPTFWHKAKDHLVRIAANLAAVENVTAAEASNEVTLAHMEGADTILSWFVDVRIKMNIGIIKETQKYILPKLFKVFDSAPVGKSLTALEVFKALEGLKLFRDQTECRDYLRIFAKLGKLEKKIYFNEESYSKPIKRL